MGFKVRKSIKIAPGVRLNVSNKNLGLSAGVRGARVSVNTNGRTTRTVGIPGTGISHTSTTTAGRRAASSSTRSKPQAQSVRTPAPKKVKPGLTAPAWEKQLFKHVSGNADAAAIHAIGQQYPVAAATAAMVEILRVVGPAKDGERARVLLGWLYDTGYDPSADPFIIKYMERPEISIPIATGVTAEMPWGRQAMGLFVAELEQAAGNQERATTVVEGLEPTTVAAVSLAELYAEAGRWADVVDITNGLTNEDVASTFLLIQRGTALREQGYFEAARDSLKEALRPRSRPVELRHLALVARGDTYLAEGKKAMARKDYERVLADDAAYPGLREMLEAATK
ncbi:MULTISPECIES: DUF4236 domain-containing protein [unclassified Microbacterium]|uniref:DUF4236 domain-containing protein n=1 Tax=unclassified Microbacterium TaxID=2609290 RepID=UPI0025E3AA98|nr:MULTISPECIES: DUF4236 domain-containing protein [unclassified Microbacterium]